MKNYIALLLILVVSTAIVGCGSSAPETDGAANTKMEELEKSPDYEAQMMGGNAKK
jgi:hypothetical protein